MSFMIKIKIVTSIVTAHCHFLKTAEGWNVYFFRTLCCILIRICLLMFLSLSILYLIKISSK